MSTSEKIIDEKLQKAFGRAVKLYRTTSGLSQEALGYSSSTDRTYVSGIERGVRNPTIRTIWRLAEALDTKPSELIVATERFLVEEQR